MKGLSYSFLRAICALVIGLVLVMFPDQAGDYFVITIGVIFLVPSLISIIGYFAQSTEMRRRFPIEGVGSLLFGLWLIIMPGFFADLLTFVLGFILVMGGVQQITSLSAARRWMPVPGGFYVVPVLILLAGLVALFNPTGVRSTAFIIIGISSLVYAASELLNWFKFTRRRPKASGTKALNRWSVSIKRTICLFILAATCLSVKWLLAFERRAVYRCVPDGFLRALRIHGCFSFLSARSLRQLSTGRSVRR